jgi:acyl-CoA thioesterase I
MLRPLTEWAAVLCFSFASVAQQPTLPSTGHPGLDQYRASRLAIYANDFGELARYRDADAVLTHAADNANLVVFFGDSITDKWKLEESFPGKPYINRGISGQTTPQMLVRFRQDVIQLQPRVVVILAGTNDIAGNTGAMSLEDIEANYSTMAELAGVHNIRMIFSSILPVHNYTPRSQELFAQRSPDKILQLNRWLRQYCVANGLVYLDYFRALLDDKGLLQRELAEDGLHPNAAGYKIMAPLAQQAIEKSLATGGRP